MNRYIGILIISLLLLKSVVFASDSAVSLFELSLEELLDLQVVNTASGFDQNIQEAPASVNILNRENWEAMGARSLSEAIQHLPSVHVAKSNTGLLRNRTMLRGISGAHGEQVLITIDGNPIKYIQENGVTLGQRIPLVGIKRIEVVKGPGSSIYGADAMGGIINLVSDDPNSGYEHITVRAGEDDSYDTELFKTFNSEEIQASIAVAYQKSNDDSGKIVESDLQSVFDQIFGTDASEAPGRVDESYEIFSLSTQWQWKSLEFSTYHWENSDGGLGVGVADALDPSGHSESSFDHFELSQSVDDLFNGKLRTRLFYEIQRLEVDLNVFPAGAVLPIGSDGNISFGNPEVEFTDAYIGSLGNKNETYKASFTYEKEFNSKHYIRLESGYQKWYYDSRESKNFGPGVIDGSQPIVGGELTDVSNTPYVYLPDSERDLYYISIQDSYSIIDNLHSTLGVRYDKYSDFGETTNPRVGLIWDAKENLSIKLFAGTAFRAPSFVDLYSKNNPAVVGNEDVDAETIETYELAFFFSPNNIDDFNISATFFKYNVDDIIIFETDPDSGQKIAQNDGEQDAYGYEFEVNWKPVDELTLSANYSQLFAEDEEGNTIADVPQKLAYLGATWLPFIDWQFHLSGRWVADRARAWGDSRSDIDNYIWGKFRIQKQEILPGLSASISIDNLFDDDAKEPRSISIPDDIPLHGRRCFVELKYEF